MASPRVLLSGDYWHADFQDLIAQMFVPATLIPLDKLPATETERFSLVLIAQSRSNQFDQTVIDTLVALNPLTPVVMLLGSWCEGERRSDQPVEGVKHVYWHQWEGKFAKFCQQMSQEGVSLWHTPATQSDADRIIEVASRISSPNADSETASSHAVGSVDGVTVGISALDDDTFETLHQAVVAVGGKSKWVERTSWINLSATVAVICVDANSFDSTLERRIRWLQNQTSGVPVIVMLNFPRREEIESLKRMSVISVISKPFELSDLKTAIVRAMENSTSHKKPLRGPSFKSSRSSTYKR
jgi:hypothetical protein